MIISYFGILRTRRKKLLKNNWREISFYSCIIL